MHPARLHLSGLLVGGCMSSTALTEREQYALSVVDDGSPIRQKPDLSSPDKVPLSVFSQSSKALSIWGLDDHKGLTWGTHKDTLGRRAKP